MTDVILSFDSEDYLTPGAADAELWWAEALRERGIRGCWQVVGELARALRRWQREDVIEAISWHEVGYHTNLHSQPPTHPEALEGKSLSEGVAYVLRTEAAGLAALAEAFGRWPVSYCSPGDSWTPATLLAMARMGIRVFCNDRIGSLSRTPYWYCGLLTVRYDLDFQEYYEDETFETGAFERSFESLLKSTPEDGVIVLYTHPTRLVTAAFWDEPFAGGRRRRIADCPPAPLRPAEQVRTYQARCSDWLDWLMRRGDLRFIDFATLYRERAASRRDLAMLCAECAIAPGAEGELPLRQSGSEAFLPSAAFAGMKYDWLPYPAGFRGERLIEQARHLTWTAGPAVKDAGVSVPGGMA